jgi:23S rRNA pseudouridine1911/1915/1917 synthase
MSINSNDRSDDGCLESERFCAAVTVEHAGQRLDQVAAELFSQFSRSRLQAWIKSGHLTVNNSQSRPKEKLLGGERLALTALIEPEERWRPQLIPLDIVHSDEHIIVINKPAGLVVHPGAGVPDGTLLNTLLYHFPDLSSIPRAGIVHRLDKNTSGLIVVARSLLAHAALVDQLQRRSLGREYEAIVMGELTGGGKIDKPIGRHSTNRLKMAVLENSAVAKEALTHYRLIKRYRGYTHVLCQLATGRTHQIRVHMAYIKHPIVGDPIYLGRQRWFAGTSPVLKQCLVDFPRQALHAKKLSLVHPKTEELLTWSVDRPEDMQQLLYMLDKEAV